MAGDEPDPAGEPGPRRWQDRDTEPIPRARPTSSPYDDLGDDDFPPGDEFPPRRAGGAYYDEARTTTTVTEEEVSGLRGSDAGQSYYPNTRIASLNAEPSRHVARYLFPTEKFRGEWKRHWIQLAKEISVGALATVLMGYITGWLTKQEQTELVTGVVIIWALIMLYVVWKVADWYFDRFILTNKRVMVVSGIFTRNVAMMPLARVTDMKYVQSPIGRVLSYGNFELESAGQDQALRNIKNLPNPNELYLRIVEEMYEPEAVEARLGRVDDAADDGGI